MREGICAGGPLDGRTYTVRSDGGFVAVDKPAGLAWVYRYAEGERRFVVSTEADPSLTDPVTGARRLDPERIIQTALNEELDVVAVPGQPGEEGADNGE